MIEIINQTNLDTSFFISDQAPTFQVVALNLGLIKKGYTCGGTESIVKSSRLIKGQYYSGIQARFSKAYTQRYGRSYFKRSFVTDDETKIDLSVTNIFRNRSIGNISCDINISPIQISIDQASNNIVKFTKHLKPTERMCKINNICIDSKTVIQHLSDPNPEQENDIKQQFDTLVYRIKTFEKNFIKMYPMLMLRNFSGEVGAQRTTLAEFDKFSRFIDIIDQVTMPSEEARKKFIDICEIFRSNNVINNIKVNSLELTKENSCLRIKLFGIPLLKEIEIKHFMFLDHPGLNFVADFVDKTNMFDNIEAKISKEIFTRI